MSKKKIIPIKEKIAIASREMYNVTLGWEFANWDLADKYWKHVWLEVADVALSTPVDEVITINDLVTMWNDGRLAIKEPKPSLSQRLAGRKPLTTADDNFPPNSIDYYEEEKRHAMTG
jgi:hypothetical protein